MKIFSVFMNCKRWMATFVLLIPVTSATISRAQSAAASDALVAQEKGNLVPFDISAEGVQQPVRWGIDTAWLWDWWPLRATNHMQECASLGRVTIDPRTSGNNTALSTEQTERLDLQLSWLKKSGVKELYLLAGNASGQSWQTSMRTAFINDIALAVTYLQGKGYVVTAISPFNEPDYGPNNAPGAAEMATVARQMRQHEVLKSIDVAGPSTLNPDYAASWWSTMSSAIQIGNTHQLAGSFDNFARFYAAVQSAGKRSAGDELHNINDALIGMNYGMSDGIWWSDFGSYTRAELGRASNDGARIGYAENRGAWTSAAVFRRQSEPLVEAFLGTSERQAVESAFSFVSQDRLAYFDGYGPYYDYTKATPGGTGYQNGQTNSEYVIEITQGEDVPVGPLNGRFKIVNKATGKLLTASNLANNGNITQADESGTAYQTWLVEPIAPRDASDFAHVNIRAAKNSNYYLDGLKYAASNGARVLLYAGNGNECERWHLHYKGDGYYVITNYDSGLSLEGSSNNSDANTTGVVQWARTGSDRQLWRFVPADATVEDDVPDAPTGLQVMEESGSIKLSWTENTESDLLGYMVYRYNEEAGIWETLGRQVKGTSFIDNYCAKGRTYRYRLRAVDQAWNLSEPSGDVSAATTATEDLIGEWHLRDNLNDYSENALHAVSTGVTFAANDIHAGAVFDGTKDYIALPYHVADMQALTVCAWVKPSSVTAWQRIFDFGRSTENYLMLTPSNGSYLRFEICKDGTKQGVNATRRLVMNQWTHVTVTLGSEGACIYLDGQLNASSDAVTFRPSDVRPVLCFLGRSMFDSDPLLKGILGDVRLYNHALSATEVQALYYQDQLNEAIELAARPMNKEARACLSAVVDDFNQAVNAGNVDDIATAIAALSPAMNAAQVSAKAYSALTERLAWSRDLSTAHPQQDADAKATYEQDFATMETAYLDGELADDEIAGACADVRTFTNRYLMTDVQQVTNRFTDISYLLFNPDFADNTTDGWTIATNSNSGYSGKADYGCFEVWNHTFSLLQSLDGMPAGTYRLQVQGFYRNGSKDNSGNTDVNAFLVLDKAEAPVAPISRGASSTSSAGDWYAYATNKKVPNDMEAAAAAFNTLNRYRPTYTVNSLSTDFLPDDGRALTFGLRKTVAVADDWTIVNYFSLSYQGMEADGIGGVKEEAELAGDKTVYDLTGRRIDRLEGARGGLYIVGGRKVLVK